MIPKCLAPGDEVRVIAPAQSMRLIASSVRDIAVQRLQEMGLRVSFSAHCEESDAFMSSSIASRLEDLHAAFADPHVKAILTVIGGYNSIQLVREINYALIRKNPKIFCGYSDITTLQNALFAKTGLVTFSGPHFSTFGCLQGIDYVSAFFQKALFSEAPIIVTSSETWSDDAWYLDQEKRLFIPNSGMEVIQEGKASGTLVGGNLGSLSLLQGTEYMPSLQQSVLFLEDTASSSAVLFDRKLQSLLLQKEASGIQGLVIGRFQPGSKITKEMLGAMIHAKKELRGLPVIAGVDFGHTMPMMTFPIGGRAELEASGKSCFLRFHAAEI